MESPPALRRVRVELAAHEAEGIVERAVELGAQPRNSGALLVALGRQPLGVGGESQLDLPQHLLLSLLELGDPHLGRLGDPIEVLRPARQLLLDQCLNVHQLVGERRRSVVLPLGHERPPLLRDLPLLFLQQRARVGAGAGERQLELLPEPGFLPLDGGEKVRLCLGKPVVHRSDALQCATEEDRSCGGERAGRQPGRGDLRYVQQDFTLLGDARWTTAAPTDRLSGTLRGVYTLPRGQITGRIFQRYGGGEGGSDSRVNGAAIGFTHELNSVSSVAFDASYATQVDEEDDDEPSIDRTDLTASYIHSLTATVSAQIGYGFRNRVQDPEDATSNRIFVVIGKTFETGL